MKLRNPSNSNGADTEFRLTEEQLAQLDDDTEVWRKVRDARVQATLARILNARDCGKALRNEMEDPGFLEFCDDVLAALGMKEAEDN